MGRLFLFIKTRRWLPDGQFADVPIRQSPKSAPSHSRPLLVVCQ